MFVVKFHLNNITLKITINLSDDIHFSFCFISKFTINVNFVYMSVEMKFNTCIMHLNHCTMIGPSGS